MTRFLAMLGQLLLVVAGYVAACFMVALSFVYGMAASGISLTRSRYAPVDFDVDWQLLLYCWPDAVEKAFLPALVFIVLSEVLAIRIPTFYVATGLVAGVIASFWGIYARLGTREFLGNLITFAGPLALLIGCGALAGLTYWAIAGRRAGQWRHSSKLLA